MGKAKKHSPEQIVNVLPQIEGALAAALPEASVTSPVTEPAACCAQPQGRVAADRGRRQKTPTFIRGIRLISFTGTCFR